MVLIGMETNNKKESFDLEDRLIDFSAEIIRLSGQLPNTYIGKHLGQQLVRSGTSPALNYAEAQGAESKADFRHKISLSLKELRESQVCLKIIMASGLLKENMLQATLRECNELVAIFATIAKKLRKSRVEG